MYNTTLKAKFEGKPSPYPVILPDSPRFTIVDVDKAYCNASHKRAADLMNKGLFEAFADIPNDPGSNAKRNIECISEFSLPENSSIPI